MSDSSLITLAAGTATAVVSPRAASLRALRVDGLDLVEPTTLAADPPGMAGAVLAPWPNRVAHARWDLDGVEQRLAVTEPELGHANHGLLAGHDYAVRELAPDTVTLAARVAGHQGYPFDLDAAVTYRLDRAGIEVQIAFTNLGDRAAPVAVGAHPYLRIGSAPTEAFTVRLDADAASVPGPTYLPGPLFDVTATEYDLRTPTPFPKLPDHVTYRCNAPARHQISTSDTVIELWTDAHHRWLQLYIAETLPTDEGPRRALALEPMTAPPNALRTGEDLHWLAPGRTWTTAWGLSRVSNGSDRAIRRPAPARSAVHPRDPSATS